MQPKSLEVLMTHGKGCGDGCACRRHCVYRWKWTVVVMSMARLWQRQWKDGGSGITMLG